MVSAKAGALTAIVIADALAAAWVFLIDGQLLNWWLIANAMLIPVVVVAAVVARSRAGRRPARVSFSQHPKIHGLVHETMNGEVVKSGGERMIADYLFRSKVRYEYEKPAIGTSNRTISRPDFYLPDYDVYVEYWGMVDTQNGKDRKEYARGMEWKMAKYRENGIRIISIYPNEIEKLDSVFRRKLKEATGKGMNAQG
jgi:hypothetical protein